MKEMNPREARVYAYIRKTIEEQGYAPSVRDVCTALGYRSTSTVHRYLERLERMGYIEKTDGKSRALRVGGWHGNAPVRVPVLGKVTAGIPIPVVENEYVHRGDLLGYVAEPTKYYTVEGTNVFFEFLKDGVPVDALDFLE